MRKCELRELGRLEYGQALQLQQQLVANRKQGAIPDQLLLLEHPHTITLGRNGNMTNLLANEEVLRRSGIAFHPTDRGGDITYHGPGQLVGYPILDLREWKRDVMDIVLPDLPVDADAAEVVDHHAGFRVFVAHAASQRGQRVGRR